jgi:hypothetical protein
MKIFFSILVSLILFLQQPFCFAQSNNPTQNNSPDNAAPVSNVKREEPRKEESRKDENNYTIQSESSLFKNIEYPELQVVPRATERLQIEAQEENNSVFSPYWPVQLSAVATFLAGYNGAGKYVIQAPKTEATDGQKAENKMASNFAMATGGLWLGVTWYVGKKLSYAKSSSEVKKYSGKDKRSELTRERLAEEALEEPAKIAHTFNRLAIFTNLLASGYIASQSEQQSPNYAAIAVAMSFLPWFMENRSETIWEKHMEYKRKIYAPLSMMNLQFDSKEKKFNPQMALVWNF